MSDCTCPPTVGNSHLGTVDHVPSCPVHGKVAPHYIEQTGCYSTPLDQGFCSVCQQWHIVGKEGCCGKG